MKRVSVSFPYVQGTTEPIKRVLNNCNIKVTLKPHQTIGNLFRQAWRPRFEKSNPRRNLFHSVQRLRRTLHWGDQTEIQYSTQRTPKSGRTKTSQEICTRRTLFTIWSHHRVGSVYVLTPTISLPELRSPWPAVEKRELWEHTFQACAIALHTAAWARSTIGSQNFGV